MTDLEAAVQLLGGDTNKVIYDDVGLPSIMVYFPKKVINEVYKGLTATSACPAFIVNGNEIDGFYVSKYQNIVINTRAYSLPLQKPKSALTYDEALTYCNNKGNGWHLYTNAERAYIAELCNLNGYNPGGNIYYGINQNKKYETGVKSDENLVFTGSGPKAWAHNNDVSGVWDLVGNVAELITGIRLLNYEIQIIADNDAADNNKSLAENSLLWKCIGSSGLVEQGTKDTLKYDYIDNKITIVKEGTGSFEKYVTAAYSDIVNTISNSVLSLLGIAPLNNVDYKGRILIDNKITELLPAICGGYNSTTMAGISGIYYNNRRNTRSNNVGFRACYVEL